jgi:hypothetical protein
MAGVGVADPDTVRQARKDPNKVQKGHFTMPLWAWAAVGGGMLFFGYRVYKARKADATSGGTSSGTATSTATSTTGATATGCVDSSGNATPCPVYVPVPTATQQGNTPTQQGEYDNLLTSIGTLQGTLSQPLTTATLEPGEQINVPTDVNSPSAWADVAKAWGITEQHLLNNNPGDTTQTTGQINIPYLVKSGDTWAAIAQRDNISPLHLEQSNPTFLGPGGSASGSQSNPVNASL